MLNEAFPSALCFSVSMFCFAAHNFTVWVHYHSSHQYRFQGQQAVVVSKKTRQNKTKKLQKPTALSLGFTKQQTQNIEYFGKSSELEVCKLQQMFGTVKCPETRFRNANVALHCRNVLPTVTVCHFIVKTTKQTSTNDIF